MKWILILLLLSGCSTLSSHKTEGWPQMTVTENYVSEAEVKDRCGNPEFLACAYSNVCSKTCNIWLPKGAPEWLVKHERGHCEGYDHPGSTVFEQLMKEKCT